MALSEQIWVMTGAGGVVASCLRAGLSRRLAALRILDTKPLECIYEREESFTVDLRDQQSLDRAFEGAYGVLHLAGLADEADFHDLVDVNILGTFHVLEATRRAGCTRVYSTEDMVNSYMPPRPDGLYGVSKVAGEALCRLYSDKFGLQVAVLRIGSLEEAPLDQRQLSTWLSPFDCVNAFLAAMTSSNLTFSAFYAVSGNQRCWWNLNEGIAIGFKPQDDAEDYAHSLNTDTSAHTTPGPQGGLYATPSYTLDRQRSINP